MMMSMRTSFTKDWVSILEGFTTFCPLEGHLRAVLPNLWALVPTRGH